MLYGGEAAVVERCGSEGCRDGGVSHCAQVSQACGVVGVVDAEANAGDETERRRGGAVGWRKAAALKQHSADFELEGAQDVDVVGPLY